MIRIQSLEISKVHWHSLMIIDDYVMKKIKHKKIEDEL